MKPKPLPRYSMIRLLAGIPTLLLLSLSAVGQQATVPGASALEAEVELIRHYSVELIIFEYTNPSSAGTEIFDPDLPPATPEEDLFYAEDRLEQFLENDSLATNQMAPGGELFDAIDGEVVIDDAAASMADEDVPLELILTFDQSGLKILPPEAYTLADAYERLQTLDAYRPLMHAAWTQPTVGKDATTPIVLRRLGDPPLRLDGTVLLYLNRFLHLEIDFALEEKVPAPVGVSNSGIGRFGGSNSRFSFGSKSVTASTFYRIQEDRIVRNGELRYYDHPRFGVLAKISRVEDQETDDESGDLFATPIARQN